MIASRSIDSSTVLDYFAVLSHFVTCSQNFLFNLTPLELINYYLAICQFDHILVIMKHGYSYKMKIIEIIFEIDSPVNCILTCQLLPSSIALRIYTT